MIKHNQNGQISGVVVSLGLAIFLLVGALGFAGWAFSSRQDYKNNSDQKVAAAVTVAKQQEDSLKDVAFTEASKNPLNTYTGPETYGSIIAKYPKTWSGYVDDTGTGAALVDGYFYPGIVPSLTNPRSVFALRIQVLSQSYSQSIAALSSLQQQGKLTIAAYSLPKVPQSVGIKAIGTFDTGTAGEMVLLPLRNETLEISTQGSTFTTDFESKVLPNFTFSP
jgi:hypothetical protein